MVVVVVIVVVVVDDDGALCAHVTAAVAFESLYAYVVGAVAATVALNAAAAVFVVDGADDFVAVAVAADAMMIAVAMYDVTHVLFVFVLVVVAVVVFVVLAMHCRVCC